MEGRGSAGIEGENCKFVLYSVFDREPVKAYSRLRESGDVLIKFEI